MNPSLEAAGMIKAHDITLRALTQALLPGEAYNLLDQANEDGLSRGAGNNCGSGGMKTGQTG